MRNRRVVLIGTPLLVALCVTVPTLAVPASTTQEASYRWSSTAKPATPQRTMLLTPANLAPLAVFATAIEDNQAAQAFAAAEASVLASKAAASSSTPTVTGPSAPSSSSTPTGACGAEDQIAPGPASLAEAAGVPCAWVPTAVCEESGRDDPYAGYFGILAWDGYGGYGQAGAAPLDVQLGWESAHGQGPPDAPGQCHGY